MDLNEGSTEKRDEASQNSPQNPEPKQEPKQEAKPAVQSPMMQRMLEGKKFYMPKLKIPNFKERFAEYGRVLKVTKKPDMEEFKAIVKASGLGIVVIGMVGFIIAIAVQLIKMI